MAKKDYCRICWIKTNPSKRMLLNVHAESPTLKIPYVEMFKKSIVSTEEYSFPQRVCSVCTLVLELSYIFNCLFEKCKEETSKEFKAISVKYEKLISSLSAKQEDRRQFQSRGTQTIDDSSNTRICEPVQPVNPEAETPRATTSALQIARSTAGPSLSPTQCDICLRSFKNVGGMKKVSCIKLSFTGF